MHLADQVVRAWGRGDREFVGWVATPAVTARLFTHAHPGGPLWRRTAATSTAATTDVAYTNGDTDERLALVVSNHPPQGVPSRAALDLRFFR